MKTLEELLLEMTDATERDDLNRIPGHRLEFSRRLIELAVAEIFPTPSPGTPGGFCQCQSVLWHTINENKALFLGKKEAK